MSGKKEAPKKEDKDASPKGSKDASPKEGKEPKEPIVTFHEPGPLPPEDMFPLPLSALKRRTNKFLKKQEAKEVVGPRVHIRDKPTPSPLNLAAPRSGSRPAKAIMKPPKILAPLGFESSDDESVATEDDGRPHFLAFSSSYRPPSPPVPKLLFSKSPFYDPLNMEDDPDKVRDQAWMDDNGLTREQLLELKEVYALWEQLEGFPVFRLPTALRAIGQNPSEKQILDLIENNDLDQDGFLKLEEFVYIMSSYDHEDDQTMERNLIEAFQFFDKDGSGRVYAPHVKDMLMNESEAIEDAADMLKLAEIGSDGCFDYMEIVAKLTKK